MTYSVTSNTIPINTGVGSGYTFTTNNTGNINWGASGGYTIGPIISVDENLKGSTLLVKGDAEFEGDITLKGKSLKDSLETIEERLAILRPNEELEEKWDKLRDLRKMYMDLEAEIKEKEKMWAILKK